jgi:hypothetical protein
MLSDTLRGVAGAFSALALTAEKMPGGTVRMDAATARNFGAALGDLAERVRQLEAVVVPDAARALIPEDGAVVRLADRRDTWRSWPTGGSAA